LAEDEAFRRLCEASDDWHEALGAWLRAVRALQRENGWPESAFFDLPKAYLAKRASQVALAPYKSQTNQAQTNIIGDERGQPRIT
jgi:hypothetical protein